jgi:hypothetical protein
MVVEVKVEARSGISAVTSVCQNWCIPSEGEDNLNAVYYTPVSKTNPSPQHLPLVVNMVEQ